MAWNGRFGIFQFFPALLLQSVLLSLVEGEFEVITTPAGEFEDEFDVITTPAGEFEDASTMEVRRLLLNEIRSLRNDKASIQLQLESIGHQLESIRGGKWSNGNRNGNGNGRRETDRELQYLALPQDCADIRASGQTKSGVYRIFRVLASPFARRGEADVYCDMDSNGNGWLVFQRRMDGSVDFEKIWRDYTVGFGDLNREFWLGNDMLYLLTNKKSYKLRIDMQDYVGQERFAEYGFFSVGPAADNYRLTVKGYSGNAGDSLSSHSGMPFSTRDLDHDRHNASCAQMNKGAWWYNSCHESNLNGRYLHGNHTSFADGVNWRTFRGYNHSLKLTQMKIAPIF